MPLRMIDFTNKIMRHLKAKGIVEGSRISSELLCMAIKLNATGVAHRILEYRDFMLEIGYIERDPEPEMWIVDQDKTLWNVFPYD